jgi:hypothetical protein
MRGKEEREREREREREKGKLKEASEGIKRPSWMTKYLLVRWEPLFHQLPRHCA